MRYTSAVVLSTLAVGQAAASNMHNRHASFHARRQAEAKRSSDVSNVNWDKVAYDLKEVDWAAVNWSSVFASTPAAAPTPAPVVEVKKVSSAAAPTTTAKVTPTPAAVVPTTTAKPAETSKAPAYSAAQPSATAPSSGSVSDFVSAGAALASKIGFKAGVNSLANNGGIWIGHDSAWRFEVTNAGSSIGGFACWQANGFVGQFLGQAAPAIAVGLKPGEKVSISFAANVPAACGPLTTNTAMSPYGALWETWAEVTFGEWGAFDVSRNVNMHGSNVSMKGSKCVSDMNTCVFKCQDSSAASCEKGYDLYNCGAGSGGGGGYDAVMQGTGGGCAMGSDGEVVEVSFS